ncbi:sensor domain-containing protein [Caminibacter mediatlanticus]|uniref:EAL domain-containing protein n=1 Tax=Caminibacter mediatlanticus TB-2 TaxID=391592 RepID=A0AAI9F230_9BACT|nr:GGDEF domain-containing phosphodiesterase [Caminibacter mediatlanticus]EDM23330.1 hypothetical protein CMTB2_08700 [Caminibacter mediatlanticus TB-2]
MKYNCEKILQNIAASIYELKYNYAKKEIEDINFLQFAGYTKFDPLSYSPYLIKKNLIDYEKIIKKLDNLLFKAYDEIEFKFLDLDEKIKFFKAKVTLIDKDDKNLYCIGINEEISKEKENEIIVRRLKESQHIGILIFKNNILYMNDFLKKKLDVKEFENLKMSDLIKNISKEEIENIIQKRVQGKDFFNYRENIEIVYNNKKYIFNAYTNTIIYNGEYVGISLLVDTTNITKRRKLSSIINSISEKFLNDFNNREFLNEVVKIIKPNYKVFLKYKNYEFGEKIEIEPKKKYSVEIQNNILYIPLFYAGYLIIQSEFENEFDEKLYDEYEKLKNVIEQCIYKIKQNIALKVLSQAIEKSYQWVLITDSKANILYANDVVEQISGLKKEKFIGKKPFEIFSANGNKEFYKNIWNKIQKKEIVEDIFIEKNKNGEFYYLKLKIIPIEVDDEVYYVALGLDITNQKKLQESLFIDELTGLYNRKGFILNAKKRIKKENKYVLMLIDIKNFKAINQVNGNIYGDLKLKQLSEFLRAFFYEEDLIGRIGGDEFAVLIEINDLADISNIIKKFVKKIKLIENLDINIGIAFYPRDAESVDELIEKASIALDFAKKAGENNFEVYNQDIKTQIEELMNAKQLIKEALEKDEFIYFFQPYYSIKEDKIVGAEALIRIIKKNKIITPNFFIDYAEKSGVIVNIEEKMFKKINNFYRELQIPLSFNVSAVSFKNKEQLKKIFERVDVPITIELTEREVANNIEYTKEVFEFFKYKNFKIAIDDFGTGYSTFTYIKELNLDIVKIDMQFIKNIEHSSKDYALVKTIIILAKEFDLKVVAEGVENKKQLQILRDLGCDYIQGYLISKPLPFQEMKLFIKEFSGLH